MKRYLLGSSAFGLGLALALLWLLGAPSIGLPVARAADLTVCPSGPPTCGFSTIQEAVDAAGDGDVIKVAAGTYTDVHRRSAPSGHSYGYGSSPGIITQVVYISQSVVVRGGYTAAFTDPPDPEANPTILDAQGQGRVLLITGDISATVEGLRITGGDASGLGGYLEPWIETPGDAGGGIYVSGAAAILRHNWVFSNTAGGGGGIYLGWNDAISISGNIVMSNTADYGGGIYLDFSDATLTDNTVTTNDATEGGGLYLFNSDVTFGGNAVIANTADYGGGLHLWGSGRTFSENIIQANTAMQEGGGLYMFLSDATLTNNLIADNQADGAGSGLYISNSRPSLMHNTIARNGGGDGSGIYVNTFSMIYPPSSVALVNTILVGHTVGITVATDSVASLEATLWGTDTWANDTDWGGTGTVITGTPAYNYWGDPNFVDPDGGDYHIGPRSAAIDQGVDAGVGEDIDGDQRPVDGDGDGTALMDLGADEFALRRIYLPLVLRQPL